MSFNEKHTVESMLEQTPYNYWKGEQS